MRSGGCAVQQVLTAEAAGVVKQAVVLAKRRGHAQVTPLHVANTMLATSSGLFRVACLESHSHPLQCKALELCFNVALNRLPASSSNPMLAPSHSQHPSISNALVAAFKRAQAHQRRGSVENQQQPLLAVKIELEQLIISILDDPSVSRVMREAGFSSTQVKSNVEKAVSLELCSQSSPPHKNNSKENSLLTLQPSSSPPTTQNERKTRNPSEIPIRNEDVNIIIETLSTSRKRKSLVIVGECISNLETTVSGLMDRVDKGEVPDSLREVKFISIPPLYSFCNLQREEVEQKIGELSCLVKSLVEKGVILYLGDLKWISDYRVSLEQEKSYYCSVEHMIMEIGRLVWGIGEIGRFWLMGIATFQTYMRCRTGYHSLETAWGLHPITIPANSLGLSLVSDNDRREENQSSSLLLTNGEVKLCADCSAKFEAEAQDIQTSVLSGLPSWLKDERRRLSNNNQNCDSVMELRKKWNSFCSLAHKQPRSLDGILTLSSPCTSCFSFDQQNPNNSSLSGPMWKDSRHSGSNLIAHLQENGDSRNTFSSNPSNSANSSSDVMEIEYTQKFKEFNAENLNILCNALEKKVPWQRQVIPEIAGTILQSRSRMLRRKDQSDYRDHVKEETWLFFLGPDPQAKEQISRELAKIVFGSYSSFLSIGLSSFVSSDVDYRNKRGRDEESCMSYIERFAQAVSFNPHRVFLVEDLDQADYCSQMGVKRAIERGRIRNACGEEVGFYDAIVILSCESFSSRSRASSPNSSKHNKTENAAAGAGEEETGHCGSLDLNVSFDDTTVEDRPVDDLGILENVDRRVVFKIQDL